MFSNWNPAAVVFNQDTVVLFDGDFYLVAVTRKGFINAVVDDLENQMVKCRCINAADVHSRAKPDTLQPFEDGNVGFIVTFVHFT